ncbi:MAG: phosphate/phosphite/phosphonate ABC transporter substrate-binding protein [Deltaproteobacteria bacterium]|nr:phosphate/phosphite/phosphonate ABC transporter substrate-binding protein [Deltaproteobacteria bacterium]MBW2019574.1 phosphate/phosphite/phosphonate ABC transporter substrate-binding protein [Deltaproteobacteria bacterium]MBW2074404.1 phosphate/phosphite/phosphonate ABC transporter substrate-binding protein [Deltaproteobacteria bacterium]
MQIIKNKVFVAVVALSCLFAACSKEEPAQKIDLSKREAVGIREEEDVITYAYLPQYSHTVSYQRHYLLVEYLKKETGLNIKQVFPDTFDEHMRMVGQEKIDISFSNPFIYVKIAHRYGARAFARTVEVYGKENFRGQIICRADNKKIRTLEDCKGKRWVAVDPSSAGGYLYALGHFIDHGISKEDFAEIAFAPGPGGKQEKVVLAVYAGKYDIGSIREGTLNVVADKIDINQIRVIAHTKWYPGWVYASRRGLEQEIVDKIREALVSLDYDNPEHKKILDIADIIGVVPSEDLEFDSIRDLAAKVGIDLDE